MPASLPIQESIAGTVARRMRGIHEPAMRLAIAGEFLTAYAPDTIAATLAELLRTSSKNPDHLVAFDTILTALAEGQRVPYTTRSTIYAAAKNTGHEEIARLLFSSSPVKGDVESIDPLAPERPVTPRGRPLSLGERKSLARGHRRIMLPHLLRDPHPDVVAILLDNPHLTEADVIRIATRRPASPQSLATVAGHAKWILRYAIRSALVKNPYTPLHIALRLTTGLRRADLRAVADDPNLPHVLRTQATELLKYR